MASTENPLYLCVNFHFLIFTSKQFSGHSSMPIDSAPASELKKKHLSYEHI